MRTKKYYFAAFFAIMFGTTAMAGSIEPVKARALATQHACFACHGIDNKLVGPAWRDVSTKYAGKPEASKQLVTHIQNGSSGAWGAMPMPPNKINTEDATVIVQWILAGAKDH